MQIFVELVNNKKAQTACKSEDDTETVISVLSIMWWIGMRWFLRERRHFLLDGMFFPFQINLLDITTNHPSYHTGSSFIWWYVTVFVLQKRAALSFNRRDGFFFEFNLLEMKARYSPNHILWIIFHKMKYNGVIYTRTVTFYFGNWRKDSILFRSTSKKNYYEIPLQSRSVTFPVMK